MLRVLSLGAGVQSTTMALMAAHGEFDVLPDCAIFADTQSEPKAVYDHLKWLMSDNVLPFPVHIVTRGNLGEQVLANVRGEQRVGKRDTIPAFTAMTTMRTVPAAAWPATAPTTSRSRLLKKRSAKCLAFLKATGTKGRRL
jgi:hypothetical protein